ncbi:MAG: CopD family protein [Ilumatobacteraceae bacterium]
MPARTGVPARSLGLAVAALAAIVAVVLGLALDGGRPARAQESSLVESQPADGADLATPPDAIVLTFDGPIGNANQVSVACNSDPVSGIGQPVISDDNLTLTLTLDSPLPAGTCNVGWGVSQPTGEPGANGRFSFDIETSTAVTPGSSVPSDTTGTTAAADTGSGTSSDSADSVQDASDVSDGATWLGRVLSTLGLAVLFGSLVLILVAWPEGPEYILAVRFLRSVWLLTLVGTLLYVVALTAAVKGESFGTGLNPAGWIDLFDAGWAGRAAVARLVLVVACLWVVLRPERIIDPTTQLPAIAIPTLAVVTLGLSRTGGDLAVLGVIAGIGHALAMAVWVGGVVLLARVVLAGPGEEDLVHAVRGFNRISGPAIVVTVVTGLIQLYRLDGGSLFSEPHGRVLLVKTVLVAAMLFVGLTARQVAQARLARAADLTPPTADRLRRAFGTEALIGVLVIGLSGWLLSFTPGKIPATDGVDYVIEEQFLDPASSIDVTVSLAPGRVGLNQLRVEVREPASDLTGLTVTFVPPEGSGARGVEQSIPLSGAGIAVSPPDYLPLDVAGAWTMKVSATTLTGNLADATRSFDVRTADGETLTPGIGTTPVAPAVSAPTTTATALTTTTVAG